MIDPRQEALQNLERLLARSSRESLSSSQCLAMVEQVRLVPGYARRVAHALSAQRSSAGVEALLALPPHVPGVVEGLYQAVAHGVSRRRADGSACPPLLAMDFRRSRARQAAEMVHRARAVFGESFETLRVDGTIHYRFSLRQGRGTLAGRASAASRETLWLHGRLSKLRGSRLWLNGWCFPSEGPIRGPIQVHLVRAWFAWAASQTQTRS